MATVTFLDELIKIISLECGIIIREKREIRLEGATKIVAMAENRRWSTKRKTKARSARLVPARMSRVTAEQEISVSTSAAHAETSLRSNYGSY